MTKKTKPVVSDEIKKFLEEQEKTDALNALRHKKNVEAEELQKKEDKEASATTQEKWEASQPKVESKTKEDFKKIMELYKQKNPVKYAAKEARLKEKLASL